MKFSGLILQRFPIYMSYSKFELAISDKPQLGTCPLSPLNPLNLSFSRKLLIFQPQLADLAATANLICIFDQAQRSLQIDKFTRYFISAKFFGFDMKNKAFLLCLPKRCSPPSLGSDQKKKNWLRLQPKSGCSRRLRLRNTV